MVTSLHASNTLDQLYIDLDTTYDHIRSAEAAGGNVSSLVDQLNQVLTIINAGRSMELSDPTNADVLYQQAKVLIDKVNQEIPRVQSEGAAAAWSELFWTSAIVASLAAIGIVIYFFGGRVFWRLWIRTHQDWVVKKS